MEDSNETTKEKKGGKTVVIILMSLFVFIFSVMPILFMMYLAYKDYMKPKQNTIQSTLTSDTSTINNNPDTTTKPKPNLAFIPPTEKELAYIPMGNTKTQTQQAFEAINKNKLQQSKRQEIRRKQIQDSRKRMEQEIQNFNPR